MSWAGLYTPFREDTTSCAMAWDERHNEQLETDNNTTSPTISKLLMSLLHIIQTNDKEKTLIVKNI